MWKKKNDFSTILSTNFSIIQNMTTKKRIPEQPQGKVVHFANLYLTFKCDTRHHTPVFSPASF